MKVVFQFDFLISIPVENVANMAKMLIDIPIYSTEKSIIHRYISIVSFFPSFKSPISGDGYGTGRGEHSGTCIRYTAHLFPWPTPAVATHQSGLVRRPAVHSVPVCLHSSAQLGLAQLSSPRLSLALSGAPHSQHRERDRQRDGQRLAGWSLVRERRGRTYRNGPAQANAAVATPTLLKTGTARGSVRREPSSKNGHGTCRSHAQCEIPDQGLANCRRNDTAQSSHGFRNADVKLVVRYVPCRCKMMLDDSFIPR